MAAREATPAAAVTLQARMGRLTPTYSDDQRQAVSAAINAAGMSAPETSRLAATGQLNGLPAFEISPSTARDVAANDARADSPSGVGGGRNERIRRLADRGIELLERQREQIAQRQYEADGDLQAADLTRLEKIARAARELAKLTPELAYAPAPPQSDDRAHERPDPALKAILEAHRDRTRQEATEPSDTPDPTDGRPGAP